MSSISRLIVVGVAIALLAACGGNRPKPQADLMDRTRDLFLLLRYDTNGDHKISREEMDAGLKADYAAADANHDGKLSPDEVQAENQRRWALEGPQSSPLMDWNMDGNVSIQEFSNAVHSLFTMVDRNKDSTVTVAELQAPRGVPPPAPQRMDPRNDVPGGPQPGPMTPGSGY